MKKQTILIIAIAVTTIWLLARDSLARWVVEKKIDDFCRPRLVDYQVSKVDFVGFRTIEISQLMLKPKLGDTLLQINRIEARVNIPELLIFRKRLSFVSLSGLRLNFQKTSNDSANYLCLFPQRQHDSIESWQENGQSLSFYKQAENLLGTIFSYLPKETFLYQIDINADLPGESFHLQTDSIFIKNRRFKTQAILTSNNKAYPFRMEGKINRRRKTFDFKVYKDSQEKVKIPYLKTRLDARIEFDTLHLSLDSCIYNDHEICLKGNSGISGLIIENRRISSKEVSLENLSLYLSLKFGDDYFCIDSSSFTSFNLLQFNPFLLYKRANNKMLTVKLIKPYFAAQNLFSSLPGGLFYNLQGIKVNGELLFRFYLNVDLENPDSIEFESKLDQRNFAIVQYGNTDFRMLNQGFNHLVYENDDTAAIIYTDASNPKFVAIEKISPFLVHSILTSEDGQYFTHKGFIPDEIKNAIIANIKNKKFARGASTISMQLVKNVFLNHNKTITRKLEEALITWLIESQNLSTKERMLEIYLNILELGPGIYGVKQGAQYYFNKDAMDITLPEALFISSIVPRPKKFKYLFGPDNKLKPVMAGYYKFVSSKMLQRGYITQAEFDSLKPEIQITGPAKFLLLSPVDSIYRDSTETEIFNLSK